MNIEIAAAIRAAINELDRIGAQMHADFWIDELFQVNGHPIDRRWHGQTLAKIQSDINQLSPQDP
jgi:hypothetical protein